MVRREGRSLSTLKSSLGLGSMKVGLPGIIPFSSARMVFNKPEMPAAGSECPILLFI